MKTTCPDCNHGYFRDICYMCNGSGEGLYDGSACHICRGTGEAVTLCKECDGDGFTPDLADCDKGNS